MSGFRFLDGERLICPGEGALAEAPQLLAERGFEGYVAHAMEALYAPFANPVTEEAALRAAGLFWDAVPRDPAPAPELAEAAFLAWRAPAALAQLAVALGDPAGDPEAAAGQAAKLAARSGHVRLSTLGVVEEQLPAVAAAALEHPGVEATPDPPGEEELFGLLRAAL